MYEKLEEEVTRLKEELHKENIHLNLWKKSSHNHGTSKGTIKNDRKLAERWK